MNKKQDVVIIGAGASGLMCALEAGKRGRNVLIIDHKEKHARKLLISGGGKSNFTNYNVSAENYVSHNPHFCTSALKRFTQWDFIEMLESHGIAFEERKHSQLFCEKDANDILNMLLFECKKSGVSFILNTEVSEVSHKDNCFKLSTTGKDLFSESVVIATGGLSLPETGASPFGYKIAEKFGINVLPLSPGLVPFTYNPDDKNKYENLSGISIFSDVKIGNHSFAENILFTHRGISGPAILQASLYWSPRHPVTINLLPDIDLLDIFKMAQKNSPAKKVKNLLCEHLPKRMIAVFLNDDIGNKNIQEISHKQFHEISAVFQSWKFMPNGTEGYRTAEVTLGGIDCNRVSSKTMESKDIPGLFFIGEVLDVAGQLGGYNLQWAWSSGWCAGQVV